MRFWAFFFGLFIWLSCSTKHEGDATLPYYVEPTLTPIWEGDTLKVDELHRIPPFSFVDQHGKTFTRESLDGKVYVANFFFTTCPGICPRMNDNLAIVQDTFLHHDQVMLVSHTVMPWLDDVNQLAIYAEGRGVNYDKWRMLTGSKNHIYDIARNGYFADEGFGKSVTEDDDFLHTENVFLIDQEGRIRGVYNGTVALEMQRIISDIRMLL